jgi:hypothetical protein
VRAALLRRVLVAVAVAVSLCAALSPNAFAAGGQNPIVVLVPGLQMTVQGMTPTSGGGCGAQGGMAGLCQAYQAQGYDVYIPPTSTTGGDGIVINTGGDVATNASALTGYVANIESANNGANVSAVGYSMGGLMVVDAVRDDGMAVNSIVTIGSPLDGSYLANSLTWLANSGIPGVSNLANNEINSIGAGAIYSLTSDDRAAENAGQGPVGVPMTTIVGNGCGFAGDCVVGVSSQEGANSNLGPTSLATDPDVHTSGPWGILTMACGGCSQELNDPKVQSTAVQASQSGCSSSSYCIPQAPQMLRALAVADGRLVTGRSKSDPREIHLTFNTPSTMSLAAGASQTITGANVVASASPFAVECAGGSPNGPIGPATIYYAVPSDICASGTVTVVNQGSQALSLVVLSNPNSVEATVGGQGAKHVPVSVSAKAGITSVQILDHAGKVLRTVDGRNLRSVSFTATRTAVSQRVLRVTLEGQTSQYTAPIPLLRAARVHAKLVVHPSHAKAGRTVTISGTGWAAGKVHLTLVANGSTHYVLTTLLTKVTQGSFSLTYTAPSTIDARTPVTIVAGEPGRAPAKQKFVITPVKQKTH